MRRILLALTVTLALALGLETAVTYLAQRGMEKALGRQYGLQDGLRVRINSFPLVVSLAKNRIRDLRLEWSGDLLLSSADFTYPISSHCELRMNDVGLNMAAILGGRLEIRSLSRLSSTFRIPLAALEPILGGVPCHCEADGSIGVEISGSIFKCKVYVSGEDRLTFRFSHMYTPTSGRVNESKPDIEGSEVTVAVEGFPMRFALLSASAEGDDLVVKVYVEEWEGYLDASIGPS